MTERDPVATFEHRLAEALRRYAADAPTEVEPYELVHALASRRPRARASGWPWASGLSPAVAWLVLVAALVVTLAAAVAVGGGSLLRLRGLTVLPAPSGEPSVAPTAAPLEGMPPNTWSMTEPELGTAAWLFDIAQRAGVPVRSYTVAYSESHIQAGRSQPWDTEVTGARATNYYGTEQSETRVHTLTFDRAVPGTVVAAFEASYRAEFEGSWASTTCTSRQLAGRSVRWCAFNGWGPWFNWYAWEEHPEDRTVSVLYLVEGLAGIWVGSEVGPDEVGPDPENERAMERLLAILQSLP